MQREVHKSELDKDMKYNVQSISMVGGSRFESRSNFESLEIGNK